MYESGYNQKQSSCVFMAKSMQTNISGNLMFNAARAHINRKYTGAIAAQYDSPDICHIMLIWFQRTTGSAGARMSNAI